MKALPVNPTDPAVTGPDIFAKLVPMAAHEASSLYRWVLGRERPQKRAEEGTRASTHLPGLLLGSRGGQTSCRAFPKPS